MEPDTATSPAPDTAPRSGFSPLVLIVLVVMLAVGGYFILNRASSPADSSPNPSPQVEAAQTDISPTPAATFTLADVAQHATPQDCWLVIDGAVYDVSPFIASGRHPGKDQILRGCGTDASDLYATHGQPDGEPHTDKARQMLPQYYIGDLIN